MVAKVDISSVKKECPSCGKNFYLSRSQVCRKSDKNYCSPKCAKTSFDRVCVVCERDFKGTVNQKYCCKPCRKQAVSKSYVCKTCEKTFMAYKHKHRQYCSKECRKQYTDESDREREINPIDYMGLVSKITRKYISKRDFKVPIEETDQFQQGCLGLLLACSRYDSTKGVKFITFAWRYIEGYILRGINDWNKKRIDQLQTFTQVEEDSKFEHTYQRT